MKRGDLFCAGIASWWSGPAARWVLVLAIACGCPSIAAQTENKSTSQARQPSPVLAWYEFETGTPAGPDTVWVRQRGGSEVSLSSAFRFSGERSLHITEVAGNRDFAEFLAYLPERKTGLLAVQFYLLLTDSQQRLNVGLAGDQWFLSPDKNGQTFWLQVGDGMFRHRPGSASRPAELDSDDGWRDLFEPRLFAWYLVDLVVDIDRGTYDLAIHEEAGERPVVDLRGVHTFGGHAGSAVRYFSLIGDLEDQAHFDFFVDDLLIASDPAVRHRPFVAPGRRRMFVEMLAARPRARLTRTERGDLLVAARGWLDEHYDLSVRIGESRLVELEHAADEAFLAGELELAERVYNRLASEPGHGVVSMLKIADIAHLRGDVATERRLRERIYGRLEIEDP